MTKNKISKGQEKYIIKISNLAKQEERVRILGLINTFEYGNLTNVKGYKDELIKLIKRRKE